MWLYIGKVMWTQQNVTPEPKIWLFALLCVVIAIFRPFQPSEQEELCKNLNTMLTLLKDILWPENLHLNLFRWIWEADC